MSAVCNSMTQVSSWHFRSLLVVGAYFLCCGDVFADEIVIRRNIVAEINAPIRKIPKEDRAWPIYRQVRIDLGTEASQFLADEIDPVKDPERWRTLADFVRANAPATERIRQAADKPHYGSIGPDRKDDGGEAMQREISPADYPRGRPDDSPNAQGDWILWDSNSKSSEAK